MRTNAQNGDRRKPVSAVRSMRSRPSSPARNSTPGRGNRQGGIAGGAVVEKWSRKWRKVTGKAGFVHTAGRHRGAAASGREKWSRNLPARPRERTNAGAKPLLQFRFHLDRD